MQEGEGVLDFPSGREDSQTALPIGVLEYISTIEGCLCEERGEIGGEVSAPRDGVESVKDVCYDWVFRESWGENSDGGVDTFYCAC